ncbi:11122_t:CDS:2, partial [Entrophospora sp. SA101]
MKFVFYLISEWPSTTTPKCKNSSDDIFNIDAEEEMTERLFDERSEEDLLKLIDENSICEDLSKLAPFSGESFFSAFRNYQKSILKSRCAITPGYWGILDLTGESLLKLKEKDMDLLSQDFFNSIRWNPVPANETHQNYFNINCRKVNSGDIDYDDNLNYFDSNIQFMYGAMSEEELKTCTTFPLFRGIFAKNTHIKDS